MVVPGHSEGLQQSLSGLPQRSEHTSLGVIYNESEALESVSHPFISKDPSATTRAASAVNLGILNSIVPQRTWSW